MNQRPIHPTLMARMRGLAIAGRGRVPVVLVFPMLVAALINGDSP